MPDGTSLPPHDRPGFAETHRAMLRVAADSHGGCILPRVAVLAALLAARIPAVPHAAPPTLQRLRMCANDGRDSIMVWQDEAEALLALIPAAPPAPAASFATSPAAPGDAPARDALRAGLLRLARQAFGHAQLVGPDARHRDAFNALGLDALTLAAGLPAAPDAAVQVQARRLFGATPGAVAS